MTRWIARLIVFIRTVAPPVAKFVVYCLKLATVSFVAMWKGFPPTIKQIANEWVDKAVRAGFPTLWARELYWLLCATAFLLVLAGWVIMSHITVWLFWTIL